MASASLADFLRSSQIDNFAINGDSVRIGDRLWRASQCQCGENDCDGWQITPAPQATAPDMDERPFFYRSRSGAAPAQSVNRPNLFPARLRAL